MSNHETPLPDAVRALLARTGHIGLAVEVSPTAPEAADAEIARYIQRLRYLVDLLRDVVRERDAELAARARAEARADRLLAGGDALAATVARVKAACEHLAYVERETEVVRVSDLLAALEGK